MLAGGKAVIAVGYFHASERVYGRGLAAMAPLAELAVDNKTSSAPINDWLFIDAAQPGTYTLALTQSGVTLGTLPITAVADRRHRPVNSRRRRPTRRATATRRWILARASGSDGREVLGVYCDWTLDGAAQTDDNGKPKSGDLYRYRFAKGGAMRTVVATHNGVSATIACARARRLRQRHDLSRLQRRARLAVARGGWLAFLVVLAIAGARSLRRAAVAP